MSSNTFVRKWGLFILSVFFAGFSLYELKIGSDSWSQVYFAASLGCILTHDIKDAIREGKR